MAFLTLRTTDVLHRHTIHLTVLQVFMEFLINAVELVAIVPGRIREIDLCRTVTVDTPAHAEWRELFYLIHFLDGAVACLALYLASLGVLCVAKEYVVDRKSVV